MAIISSLIVAIAVGVTCFVVLGRVGLAEPFASQLAAGLGVCVLPLFYSWAKDKFSRLRHPGAPLFSEWQRSPLQM